MLPMIAKAAPKIAKVAGKAGSKTKGDKKEGGKKDKTKTPGSKMSKIGGEMASNKSGTMGGKVNLGTWGGR